MDDPKSGAAKASLSVPFLRSFRSRSSSAQPASDSGKLEEAGSHTLALRDIHHAVDHLLQTKPEATEAPPQVRFLIDAVRQPTEHGGSLLDPSTATPLVSSLTVLCSRMLRPKYALDVRLGICELLTATLRYAEASTASVDASNYDARTLTGWDATVPSQVLSSLDRALLFKLIVELRHAEDWAATQIVHDPGRALRTLACQIQALQVLSRDGRDVLAFRSIIVVLTDWLGPAWGCMLHLRVHPPANADARTLLSTSEYCAYTLLQLMASVFKFHASRIAVQQLDGALRCVTGLLLHPALPELDPSPGPSDRPAPPAEPVRAADAPTHGFYFGLEAMSPYFGTPRLQATKPDAPRPAPRARAHDWVLAKSDEQMPELRESDVHAVIKVLDAAICFAFVPASCIAPVVYALCRVLGLPALRADVDALSGMLQLKREGAQGEIWGVLGNLLRSHCANSVLRSICQLLWPKDVDDTWGRLPFSSANQPQHPSILLGAILCLYAALVWAAEDRVASGPPKRGGKDEGALTLLSLPAIAGAVKGALERNIPVLDLATVLFLDDYLPERRLDVHANVFPLREPRMRQAPVPLCTLYRENDVQSDWDLLRDLQVLARRHMAVWKSVQGAPATRASAVSALVIHILVEILSGTPVEGADAPSFVWDRTVAAMPHLSSLFWSLAPLLPDHVMVDMVLQNRKNHAYVPSSPRWIENTVELVDTFYPPVQPQAAEAIAPRARFEVVQLISNMYEAVQDMPPFRNEMIEYIVVPLLERALGIEQSLEIETMLRTMLRHAATVSALDASVGHGQPFTRLRRVLVYTVERAEGSEATVERKQARAQHSRQQSLGPSNMSAVREAQVGIQRAIRSVRDMVTIFYQLAFGMPNAAVMLPLVQGAAEAQTRAQSCSLTLFRDMLMLVQYNASFHLAGSGEAAAAPYGLHVPTEVRLVILQWLMRLRADRHHQIYFVHDVDRDVEPLAQLVQRAGTPEERRGREERTPSEARGRSPVRDTSTERGRTEEHREGSTTRAPEPPRVLWCVPERVSIDFPDEGWPSMLWKVYAHEHMGDELPTHEPQEGEPVLPLSDYLGTLINLLQSEADWDVVSYVITHLPAQLSNKHCFCGPQTRQQIAVLHDLLCPLLLQQKQFPNLLLPDDVKRTDMYAVLYATLMVLMSYRRLLSRTQHDELLEAFIAGLTKSQNTAQPCVRALVIACYELPKAFTRLVPGILVKLSTVMSSMTVSVHILELLVEISSCPALYANFTETDYKRVFGIALQYIQYHESATASSREAIRSSPTRFSLSQYVMMLAYSNIAQWFITLRLSERPKHVPYITRGLMVANEGRASLSDQTFVVLDFLARFTYSNAQSKPTRSLIRFLVTNSSPNAPNTPRRPPAIDPSDSQTWLMGKGLLTITSLKRAGWFELLVRRPSGTMSMVCKLENAPSDTLVDEERMAQALPSTLTRTRNVSSLALPARRAPSALTHPEFYQDKHSAARRHFPGVLGVRAPEQTFSAPPAEATEIEHHAIHEAPPVKESDTPSDPADKTPASTPSEPESSAGRPRQNDMNPSYFAMQLSAYPDMTVDKAPTRLPAEPATERLLRAIDLTPVYDFHKIGVLYAGFGQSTEKEILSNTHGSSAYMRFLSRLGDLIALRGQEDVYTGGLDRQQDEHGKYAYIWKDNIKQIVFHTATLMPNRENDPNHAAKKALIGNDWVHIVFNEANRSYEFGTIASQFNFCNIVISPHSMLKNGVEAYEVSDNMFCTYAPTHSVLVELQRRPGLPDFSPIGNGKLVSFETLPRFVRNLAMHCNLMSQIYLDTGESMVPYTSNWVTRLHHIERYQAQLEGRRNETEQNASADSVMDQRDYTRLFEN